MEKGRKEARIGLDAEIDLINRAKIDHKFQRSLIECLTSLGFKPGKKIELCKKGIKTDIIVKTDGKIGISIKTSTKTSFHQLDRRRLEEWSSLLEMPLDIFHTLKESVLRVSRNPRNKFILESDRDKVKKFLAKNLKTILNEIFRKKDWDLKLLMVLDKQLGKLYVFRMDDVINFLFENTSENISFSNKGIIRLGDFITIQRKGGDGKHIKISKTDWSHPGNQLQFKFSPLKFAEYCKETNCIKFCKIDY